MTVSENTSAQKHDDKTPVERRNTGDRRRQDRRAQNRYPGEVRKYNEGAVVFREFEAGEEAFIVKSGWIEVFKSFNEEGCEPREVRLGVLEEGAMFGEMALIDNEPRMASARVVGGEAELFIISRTQFQAKLGQVNPFISKLLHILAENTRATAEMTK